MDENFQETNLGTEDNSVSHSFGFALSAAGILALNAGFINAIGLLSLFNLAVSHVTGSTTNLGTALAGGDLLQMARTALVITSFFLGNVISGFMINDDELKPGNRHRYGLVLLVEVIFLLVAIWFFEQDRFLANFSLAVACGLQNGMATRYSGATVRTSHMSGIVTDMGILVGQRVRGNHNNFWRMKLFLPLFLSFLTGGILAGVAFQLWNYSALWISIIGTAAAGLSYSFHSLIKARHKDPSDA